MIQSAAVIFIVAGLAYIWGSRGFFSALLHLVCVLVGGAIAFALWEPIAYKILAAAGTSQWMIDIAWGAGLALPFAVSVAVLRLIVDKAVPANCDLDGAPNLIGGIVCGAIAGTISAGILLLTVNFLRLSPSVGGLSPIRQESNGSPVINEKLIFPADKITTWLYGYAADATLRTDTPLAKWRPDVTVDGALLRTNFNEGGSRHTLAPKSFEVKGHFTVGKDADLKVSDLLSDGFSGGVPKVTTLQGEDISVNSTGYFIDAYVVSFGSAAREKEGNVVIGNTQVELVCYNETDDKSISVMPVAVSSKAEAENSEDKKIYYGRWRFERPNTYIRSVGGTDNPLMAFEFLVPKAAKPIALYVKGVRVDLTRLTFPNSLDFADKKERDTAIQKGTALGGEPGDRYMTLVWDKPGPTSAVIIDPSAGEMFSRPIVITNTLPSNRNTHTILSKDGIGGLTLNEERQIVSGEQKYKLADLQKNRGIDAKLQVRQFYEGEDTIIVQVNFGKDSPLGPVVNQTARDASGEISLVDFRDEKYPVVGFVYYDNQIAHIRYTPEAVIRTKEELPFGGPSTSRPDQTYILLFRVSKNTQITSMKIGETEIAKIKPSLETKK
jgi:hypothetical protein